MTQHPNSASPSGVGEPLEVTPGTPDLGNRLMWTRKRLGLGIAQAAHAFGLLVTTVADIEAGVHAVDYAEAERRLRAYAAASTARPDGETT